MYWNVESYLSELSSTNTNSPAFLICSRVHEKCRQIILAHHHDNVDPNNNNNGTDDDDDRAKVHGTPHINSHLYPAIIGLGSMFSSFASTCISDHSLLMAIQDGSAPVRISHGRSKSSSFSNGNNKQVNNHNNGNIGNIGAIGNQKSLQVVDVPYDNSRRKSLTFLSRKKLAGFQNTISHSPSLEELFMGDAFSLSRFLTKTQSSRHIQSYLPSESTLGDAPLLTKSSLNTGTTPNNNPVLNNNQPAITGKEDVSDNSHYFYSELTFISALNQITRRLLSLPKQSRQSSLRAELALLNHNLPAKVCIPLWCAATHQRPYHHFICRIVVSECVVLNSAEKAPYLLLVEVLETNENEPGTEAELYLKKNPLDDLSEIDVTSTRNLNGYMNTNDSETSISPKKHVDKLNINTEISPKPARKMINSPSLNDVYALSHDNHSNNLISKLHSPPVMDADGSYDDFSPRMRTAAIMLAQLNDSKSNVKPQMMEEIRIRILNEMAALEEDRMKKVIQQRMQYENYSSDSKTANLESHDERPSIDGEEVGILQDRVMQNIKEDPSGSVFREPWNVKEKRIRLSSPYGHFSNWRLFSVIVKTGSDLRQEELACQIIREMQAIWKLESVDAWVYHYRVLITSDSSGLIETISNSISIHSIKKDALAKERIVPGKHGKMYNLRDYFLKEFGPVGSEKFRNAQRCFMESLASYSIITYILSIKDRHNGNILLDNEGHIIHIDFGFMINNSPGSVGFESAPFKFSQEYVDILDGIKSPLFSEFKNTLLKAFLALRKHADKIILLVEMMMKGSIEYLFFESLRCILIDVDSSFPCFSGSPEIMLRSLRERFQLSLTESQVEEYLERLVLSSHNNMFTRLYDSFQYYSNGIL